MMPLHFQTCKTAATFFSRMCLFFLFYSPSFLFLLHHLLSLLKKKSINRCLSFLSVDEGLQVKIAFFTILLRLGGASSTRFGQVPRWQQPCRRLGGTWRRVGACAARP